MVFPTRKTFGREQMNLSLLLVCSTLIGLVVGGCDEVDNSFEYFLLAIQWPSAFEVAIDHWTIHGLWPSRIGPNQASSYPCTCTSEKFDPQEVVSIQQDMRTFWPSLFGKTDDSFHAHEWSKHGTCSGMRQLDYFKHTLELRAAYDPKPALDQSSLVPSNEQPYNYTSIAAAYQKFYGFVPLLGCREIQGEQVLSEIGLCVSKVSLGLEICDLSVKKIRDEVNDCSQSKPIYLRNPLAAISRNATNKSASIALE